MDELNEKKLSLSAAAGHELDVLENAIREIVDLSFGAFTEGDIDKALRVEPLEEVVDDLCDTMKFNHTERLQNNECTLEQGFVFNDLLTDYERISDHCSNIAVAIIQSRDESVETHEYLDIIKHLKSEAFEMHYEDYRNRFRL